MTPNPYLKKLGFSANDRVVIIHTDDIGMCQASIQAYQDLWDFGTISSGAVMVPCPWFPAAAEMNRAHPEYDLGVHLVLTSEWQNYRWRPLTAAVTGSSLIDKEGYFPRGDAEAQEHGDPHEAAAELLAQAQRAEAFGLDITHMDTHMSAIAHAKFIPAYIQLVNRFHVPPLIPRGDEAAYRSLGMDEQTAAFLAGFAPQLEAQGLPLMDSAVGLPLDNPEGHIELAKKMLSELPAGLTHFIIHPSIDTPELRAITPDWSCRVANYKAFKSRELKSFIRNSGVHLIGYRQVRVALRHG